MSHELAGSIPDAELVIMERGGHFAPTILPEAFNEPVLRFLRARA